MKAGNSQLFFSREKTRKLIQSGEYTELLDQLQPVLRSWQKNFESLDGDFYSADLSERRLIKTVPKYSRIVLSIEFEYMRESYVDRSGASIFLIIFRHIHKLACSTGCS